MPDSAVEGCFVRSISLWLHGPSSDGRRPTCEKPCSVGKGVRSLASPTLLPTTSLSGRWKDSVTANGNTLTNTRQRERSNTVVPSSFFITATAMSPTTELTHGRSPSRPLSTQSMSAASSSPPHPRPALHHPTRAARRRYHQKPESPIMSEDDESTNMHW
ncbi:hypothetical protein BDQ12DRAFT_129361 [Crucibulum laeve]|uniref:Uncharacterized protein n=1 Tax=Crucibulum laeve TaxID=68775 RepID=A0A5C3LFG2_9AGAR|nr:hypothetical protein BDQ12DRAFT_129361 [Crucibulum laeve]